MTDMLVTTGYDRGKGDPKLDVGPATIEKFVVQVAPLTWKMPRNAQVGW